MPEIIKVLLQLEYVNYTKMNKTTVVNLSAWPLIEIKAEAQEIISELQSESMHSMESQKTFKLNSQKTESTSHKAEAEKGCRGKREYQSKTESTAVAEEKELPRSPSKMLNARRFLDWSVSNFLNTFKPVTTLIKQVWQFLVYWGNVFSQLETDSPN